MFVRFATTGVRGPAQTPLHRLLPYNTTLCRVTHGGNDWPSLPPVRGWGCAGPLSLSFLTRPSSTTLVWPLDQIWQQCVFNQLTMDVFCVIEEIYFFKGNLRESESQNKLIAVGLSTWHVSMPFLHAIKIHHGYLIVTRVVGKRPHEPPSAYRQIRP